MEAQCALEVREHLRHVVGQVGGGIELENGVVGVPSLAVKGMTSDRKSQRDRRSQVKRLGEARRTNEVWTNLPCSRSERVRGRSSCDRRPPHSQPEDS